VGGDGAVEALGGEDLVALRGGFGGGGGWSGLISGCMGVDTVIAEWEEDRAEDMCMATGSCVFVSALVWKVRKGRFLP
jgi:hypothetical protein